MRLIYRSIDISNKSTKSYITGMLTYFSDSSELEYCYGVKFWDIKSDFSKKYASWPKDRKFKQPKFFYDLIIYE